MNIYSRFINVPQFAQVVQCEQMDKLAKKCIKTLRGTKITLSGEDSMLINTWEEICVQTQYEPSLDWRAYENLIDGVVCDHIRESNIQIAEPEDMCEEYVTNDLYGGLSSFENEIKRLILQIAGEYSNARIRKYLEIG